MSKMYEIRDPIHGFVELNEWERDIINHAVFQRLRRIRQLGWTDMVYPGATHSRFEHSLGVMDIATRMFDHVCRKRRELLESELSYTHGGLEKDRVLIRLAALLHDIGHAPFSHAAEEVMPTNPETRRPYKHENYSAAAVRYLMRDVIEQHPMNQNYGITAREIADFLDGRASIGRALLWRELVSSQLDADRADYLLRDSHHIGVAYGRYDLYRLLATMTVTTRAESGAPVLAVESGGHHAAEALIVARYMMFTQVYFQKTRRAYDHHIAQVMRDLLRDAAGKSRRVVPGQFPPPTSSAAIRRYLEWTDWRVLGLVSQGKGGDDGRILQERTHHRAIYRTPEVPSSADLDDIQALAHELGDDVAFVDSAESSWYKFEKDDIMILDDPGAGRERLVPLSRLSSVVNGLRAARQQRIYVPYDKRDEARQKVEAFQSRRGA